MENYEQKYKEALARAKVVNPGTKDYNIVTAIFPELKESEDERIRKAITEIVKNYGPQNANPKLYSDMLTWLKKQGEQKQVSIIDEWIENYWQHEKVNNPNSYDKGDEIQFNHDGFVRFCKKYCQKPTWSKEDEDSVDIAIRIIQNGGDDCAGILDSDKALKWLQSLKQRFNGTE